MDPEIWGTLPTLFTGLAFTLGLVLVLIAGSSLLTGNMLLVPLSAMDGASPCPTSRATWPRPARQRRRALFVAFFLAIETGVIGSAGAEAGSTGALTYERLAGIAEKKALDESSYQIFLRALGPTGWCASRSGWPSRPTASAARSSR
jgi:hypothetical protein